MNKSSLTPCGRIVKEHDYDRFLISLMVKNPADMQALWTLFAFNHEIAKTREVVSETRLGLIRLQWWRDEIGKIYGGEISGQHEVLTPLSAIIRQYDLPQELFDSLIYAREFDLEDVLPTSIDGLIHYADFTTTPLMRLALMICGDHPDIEPVSVVAVNYALAGLLRAVPVHARQRRCYLPEDLLQENEVYTNQLYDGKQQAGLAAVMAAVAEHITTAVKTESRVLATAQSLAEMNGRHLARIDYDIHHRRMSVEPAFKALRLYWRMCFL